MAIEGSRGCRGRRRSSPCAQTLVQTAWQSSARAAGWMRSREVFHRRVQRNSSTKGCIASKGEEAGSSTGPAAIGGGGSREETHPDLLGGEESVSSNWRCWKRRWRQSSCPSIGGKGHRGRLERPDGGGGDLDRQRARGWEGEWRVRWSGWVGWPRPEPAGVAQPGGLGGPAGLLGQQASWARRLTGQVGRSNLFYQFDLIQFLQFKFKYKFFSEFKLNSDF
jgi:hypothetical protein